MNISIVAKTARQHFCDLVEQPIDSVASCERAGDEWRVVVEAVESRARLGDDDLLSVFELRMNEEGELVAYRRLGQRRRFEDVSIAVA